MSKETKLLNLICVIGSLGFLVAIVLIALTTNELLTTDNLFVMTVCLVLALAFAINPLFYLKSENKLPLPFLKKSPDAVDAGVRLGSSSVPGAQTPPLLDAKGRAVPPDVRAMVASFAKQEPKDV